MFSVSVGADGVRALYGRRIGRPCHPAEGRGFASTVGVEAGLAPPACASAGVADPATSAAAAVTTSVPAHRRECTNAISTTRTYPTDPSQGHDFTPLRLLSG